ncbi:DUF742 domain-containing protein [Micromonospora sp. NPDC049679]|uniref:DUF742 domain-containing protein n=1 Tax=Micromonospora sp. NPDC049679 TaxID=3155920 RepID=UPI0033C857B7
MQGEAPGPHHDWLDGEAGPVVRPYAVTAGRVPSATGGFDLVAFVVAGPPPVDRHTPLQPEHRAIIAATQQPLSVAEVASQLDLAVGVVRVLLGDLLAAGLIAMYEPPASTDLPDDKILKAVVDGLRAL